ADRKLNTRGERLEVRQRARQGHAMVGLSLRPREPGAGGGQRPKAEPGERARAPEIPWVRDHETARAMELVEDSAAIRDQVHIRIHFRTKRSGLSMPLQ